VFSVSLGSELKVAGKASLAGNLNVLGADRGYIKTRHQDVLTAGGGIDGQFSALTLSPGVFLQSTIGYTSTSVWLDTRSLDITKAAQAMGVTSAPDLQAASRLQSSFEMLDARLAAGGSVGASELATLEAAGAIQRAPTAAFAEASLQSLSGQLPAASAAMLFDSIDTSAAALAGHLEVMRTSRRKAGAWATSLGWQGSMQASGYATTTVQNTGSMVGADFRVGHDGLVGYALGVSRGFGQIEGAFDHGRNRANSVTVYAGWARGPWFVGGSIGTGWYRQDMQRLLVLGQIAAPVAGGFNGSFNLATGEAGMHLHFAGARIAPFVNLRYEQLDEGAFAEQGAGGFGLKADSRGTGRWQAGLGLRATRGWHLSNGMRMQLDSSAVWRHTLSQYGQAFQASFTGFDDWMPLSGVGLSRNYSVLKMGVGLWPTRDLELHLGLEGQQGQHQHAAAAMMQGVLRF
jgi:fibronectin-binding autotransporter adhesin